MAQLDGTGWVGQQGWTVGIFEWLNGPKSKVSRYWRAIENGDSSMVGRHIIGLWGPNPGMNARPNSIMSGDLSAFNWAYKKFVPFAAKEGTDPLKAARAALWYFMDGGKGRNMELLNPQFKSAGHSKNVEVERRRMFYWFMTKAPLEKIPFVQGVIKEPMIARKHYREAEQGFLPIQMEMKALRTALGAYWNGATASDAQVDARVPLLVPGKMMFAAHASYLGRDKLTGRFNSLQTVVRDVNLQVAMDFQDRVVQIMIADKGRMRPPTDDLLNATRDPRNRYPR